MATQASRQYKIILIGDPAVGKTSFFLRIRQSDFIDTELKATVLSGVEYLEYPLNVDGCDVMVRLHDTGGGERFRTLTSNFYRNADAAILMFSVEDQFTFENLQEWFEDASEVIPDLENFVWAIVGNKCDLPLEIDQESIDLKCQQIGTKLQFFTSAKTGEMVKEAFETVIREVHAKSLSRGSGIGASTETSTVKITSGATGPKKSSCC